MLKSFNQELSLKKLSTMEKVSQLREAKELQRLKGGRLEENLIALGFTTAENVKSFFTAPPRPPQTIEETGLDSTFILDLMLKHILFMGEFSIEELAAKVKLPLSVVDVVIEVLRKDHFIEVKGAARYAKVSYKFTITEQGRKRAAKALEVSRYVGPAPVSLDDYCGIVELQTIRNISVDMASVRTAFSHLYLSDEILNKVGPAVSSGKAVFLYGPPGNGKTTIAEAVGKVLPGNVYIPHAVQVAGEIITVFDPVSHAAVESELTEEEVDQRWVLSKRPFVMIGGGLTLKMLDLDFNPISKFYEAPLQMKANNGLFIVDDFGRQQMDPENLLNRWIVPMEHGTDFLALQTGMKFEIPFDQLMLFATNLEPKSLLDEAYLRRMRYKIKVDHPTLEEYEHIFRKVCESNNIDFRKDIFDYLIENYYKKLEMKLSSCQPRDIIDHIIDYSHFQKRNPELTREAIGTAWKSYFFDM